MEVKYEKKTYSIAEAAKVLGVSEPTLYREARCGNVPCVKIGRRYLIPIKALNEWLDGQVEGG